MDDGDQVPFQPVEEGAPSTDFAPPSVAELQPETSGFAARAAQLVKDGSGGTVQSSRGKRSRSPEGLGNNPNTAPTVGAPQQPAFQTNSMFEQVTFQRHTPAQTASLMPPARTERVDDGSSTPKVTSGGRQKDTDILLAAGCEFIEAPINKGKEPAKLCSLTGTTELFVGQITHHVNMKAFGDALAQLVRSDVPILAAMRSVNNTPCCIYITIKSEYTDFFLGMSEKILCDPNGLWVPRSAEGDRAIQEVSKNRQREGARGIPQRPMPFDRVRTPPKHAVAQQVQHQQEFEEMQQTRGDRAKEGVAHRGRSRSRSRGHRGRSRSRDKRVRRSRSRSRRHRRASRSRSRSRSRRRRSHSRTRRRSRSRSHRRRRYSRSRSRSHRRRRSRSRDRRRSRSRTRRDDRNKEDHREYNADADDVRRLKQGGCEFLPLSGLPKGGVDSRAMKYTARTGRQIKIFLARFARNTTAAGLADFLRIAAGASRPIVSYMKFLGQTAFAEVPEQYGARLKELDQRVLSDPDGFWVAKNKDAAYAMTTVSQNRQQQNKISVMHKAMVFDVATDKPGFEYK